MSKPLARVDIDSLAAALTKELDAYSAAVYGQVLREAVDETAKETVRRLKDTSPKRTGAYAKDWASKREEGRGAMRYHVVVYNKTHYQLIHLLEGGHVLKRGNTITGNVRAIEHVAPAEEDAGRMLEEKFKKKISELR